MKGSNSSIVTSEEKGELKSIFLEKVDSINSQNLSN